MNVFQSRRLRFPRPVGVDHGRAPIEKRRPLKPISENFCENHCHRCHLDCRSLRKDLRRRTLCVGNTNRFSRTNGDGDSVCYWHCRSTLGCEIFGKKTQQARVDCRVSSDQQTASTSSENFAIELQEEPNHWSNTLLIELGSREGSHDLPE